MTASTRECPSCRTPLPADAQFCYRCGNATPTEPGVPPRVMPTGTFEVAKVQRVLADRYRVERVIGEGGMATVYLAEDLKHRRRVAVKVMRPELAATLGGDRFLREIEIAARLNHPHILPLHDSGEAEGVLYYVMPWVEGETLASRIAREGELPVAEALRIAREVAEALGHAHRHGVVHRDVKPANILLGEGHALVADFGIARALAAEGGGQGITATGLAIGTPQYMSPEQATGAGDVDARTDVYAAGAVLYEMLAGEPPFTGRTPQAVVVRAMTERPRPLAAVREGLDPMLEQVVMRALARSPADRFPTAQALADALQGLEREGRQTTGAHPVEPAGVRPLWPVLGAVAVLALAGVAFFAGRWGLPRWVLGAALVLGAAGAVMLFLTMRAEARRRAGAPPGGMGRLLTWRNAALGGVAAMLAWSVVAVAAGAGRVAAAGTETALAGTRVAVLPFQNQGDSADDYIVDGIADEIRGRLAGVGGLAVIASGSSGEYRASRLPPQRIARELGASHLLLGRVRWAPGSGTGRRVQVVSELVDARTGATAWQQSFEAPLTDVFEVQSQIAARVAEELGTQLGTQETRTLARRPTVSPAAWDAYLKARAITSSDPLSLRQAVGHLEQAVALDSTFVEAWASLSNRTRGLFFNGGRQPALLTRSGVAYRRALALDSTSAAAHVAAANFALIVDNDSEAAGRSLAAALRLAPNDPEVLRLASRTEADHGRLGDAMRYLERARELDPRSVPVLGDLQRYYVLAHRLREAVEVSDAALALDPSSVNLYNILAAAHAAGGDTVAARMVSRRAIASGVTPPALAGYFVGFQELGWLLTPEVQALVPRLTPAAFDDDRAWWGQSLASYYWSAGRPDLARSYADSALAPSREQVRLAPEEPGVRALLGVVLAHAGRKAEAIAEGRRALALHERRPNLNRTYDRLQLVRIYIVTGEHERALDELALVLREPGYVTPAWLRIDPLFAPLRGNPRFARLAAG